MAGEADGGGGQEQGEEAQGQHLTHQGQVKSRQSTAHCSNRKVIMTSGLSRTDYEHKCNTFLPGKAY